MFLPRDNIMVGSQELAPAALACWRLACSVPGVARTPTVYNPFLRDDRYNCA